MATYSFERGSRSVHFIKSSSLLNASDSLSLNLLLSPFMASNYFHNDGRYPSTGTTPPKYYQFLLDERHPNQHISSSLTTNARCDGPVPGQSYHSADLGQSYDSDQFPTRTNSLHPGQGYGVTPNKQAPPYSPHFLVPYVPGNSVTNLRQPFDPSIGQGTSTYATQQHEQYNPIGYQNTSYTSFNSNSFQPTLPSTQPQAISNTADPSMRNAKPHSCPSCGKSFARKGDMERHARAHGPSSLWCNANGCNKGFYRSDKLREHLRRHAMH